MTLCGQNGSNGLEGTLWSQRNRMIGISKLYCGAVEAADVLRYGRHSANLPSHLLQFSQDKRPVVVWNVTRRCNLKCIHCYSSSQDLPELARYAVGKGLRVVISTNGTLITKKFAKVFSDIGLSYIGVSLDGLREVHDRFRGVKGAFDKTLRGIRNARDAGIKVGIRFTVSRKNWQEIPGIFDLIEKENIPRVCFYHLVYSGRGSALIEEDLTHEETRQLVDLIMDRTKDLFDRGIEKEVLTVDNHADGPYVYLRLLREDPKRAAEVLELLKMNEGNSSGHGIGCVSWDGAVHADQFWRIHSFGNVKDRPFGEIWLDTTNELLAKMKDKKPYVKGRCATCRWLEVCGGNFRARAEAVTGDPWAADPACYLTEEEIKK
jgi:radical SAM protein with 4Fe4S-binding SPASM domain